MTQEHDSYPEEYQHREQSSPSPADGTMESMDDTIDHMDHTAGDMDTHASQKSHAQPKPSASGSKKPKQPLFPMPIDDDPPITRRPRSTGTHTQQPSRPKTSTRGMTQPHKPTGSNASPTREHHASEHMVDNQAHPASEASPTSESRQQTASSTLSTKKKHTKPLFDLSESSEPAHTTSRQQQEPNKQGEFLSLHDTPPAHTPISRLESNAHTTPHNIHIGSNHVATRYARAEQLHTEHLLRSQPRAPRQVTLYNVREAPHSPWRIVIFIATISIVIIFLASYEEFSQTPQISHWLGNISKVLPVKLPFMAPAPNPVGDYRLASAPSLAAEDIDTILLSYGSPAYGTGQTWVDKGRKYNIDPAFALAFFIHESTAGSHPGWAGHKPNGGTTHNVGNIICAGYPTCHGRFRDYVSWEEGIEDWYRLIHDEYIEGRGTETVADIIPIYAPAFENDVDAYVTTVERKVDSWRESKLRGVALSGGNLQPKGNPLQSANAVMTQDYGVGSHAPAHVWGAIDLAFDSNGDGHADPSGSTGQPIYATHSGAVRVTPNSWPAGNHVWVINSRYKTGYAHLQDFTVASGDIVQRGDIIGYMGSSGQSSGPHLDYQVWQYQDGTWVNHNPLDFDAIKK